MTTFQKPECASGSLGCVNLPLVDESMALGHEGVPDGGD